MAKYSIAANARPAEVLTAVRKPRARRRLPAGAEDSRLVGRPLPAPAPAPMAASVPVVPAPMPAPASDIRPDDRGDRVKAHDVFLAAPYLDLTV